MDLRGELLAALAVLALAAGCGGEKSTSCPTGTTDCLGVCRDLQSDRGSCGTCGLQCMAGGICTAGVCACPPPTSLCGSACVDTSTNASSCGSCGHACGAGTCAAGACACSTSPGVKDCGATQSPQCRGTLADRLNCGDCGVACGDAQICASGTCQTCAAPAPDRCGNACVDLATDAANCGACGNTCGPAQTCSARACTCTQGLAACGTACVDLTSDPANCGTCGRACGSGFTCTSSACVCQTGLACGSLCCAGTACCGGGTACQTAHDNGTGGSGAIFYDCFPAGSSGAARDAALAWAPAGRASAQVGTSCSFSFECVAWENGPSPSACGVWCYAGIYAGRVEVTTISPVCLCPTSLSPTWH